MNDGNNENTSLGLIMVDIDHFKQINDKYGHTSGDIVLKLFADCLKKNLRPKDIFGRYGGDEFVICLMNTTQNAVIEIAERLRQKTSQMLVSFIDTEITASFGIALHHYNSKEDIDSLIRRADNCMYKAKEKRNSIYVL
jgi:diguanylate cyclase (GGDEF)-like protein